jgi:hypothetical protein
MNLCPSFDHQINHQFHLGETVYVIDDNDYDIWEARVKKLEQKRIFVSFEHEIDNDQWINRKRILMQNDVNNEIFREQERIRKIKCLRESEFENEVLEDAEENEEALLEESRQQAEFEKWMPWLRGILTKCSVGIIDDEIGNELSLPEVVNAP